jgi:hypothetical protein
MSEKEMEERVSVDFMPAGCRRYHVIVEADPPFAPPGRFWRF